jgi:hypothetical protein
VIGLGFAGQFRPAEVHQFDDYIGFPPTASADCSNHDASTEQPLVTLR